jgi:hypothetical protein
MTTTAVREYMGVPALFLDGAPVPPIISYVGPNYTRTFSQAGIALYTFGVPGRWWVGPGQYDFEGIDAYLADYVARVPEGYFMPRINLAPQGHPWWGQTHPEEMNVLRSIETGEVLDQSVSDPRTPAYLGHDVRLGEMNLHSFHSTIWREEAGRAVAALVAHCEAQPYADRIWAWHLCDGLFSEWFHWNEYSFGGLADYSPAAQADFRRWLREAYDGDVARLQRAWGREVDFESAAIPAPAERMRVSHGEFYDPVSDRPTIDYTQCMSDATVDSIIAVCSAAKGALPQPKVACVFYGYQFSNMPRPQLNAHYALRRLLKSDAVDLIASPHAYGYRGEGGYHSPQSMADTIRRAGKIHIDEIDCKTVWTPASVTWKRHISQPQTTEATIEMMKKDAAYQLASGTSQWWMDLTNQGWFDAPEAVEPMRRLKAVEERLQVVRRDHFGEVAFVVSQRAMMFMAPNEGLHNATQKMFRNWHLSRMGAPFEQLLIDDLALPDLPRFKLYIMANVPYLSDEERALVERVAKRDGATVLWVYAPGFLNDDSASVENMAAMTGMRHGMADVRAELDVEITRDDHPITAGLAGVAYGTGVGRDIYTSPPRIQYMPETAVAPAFYVDDPEALVLGTARSTGMAGLAVKEFGVWRSIYSAAPLMPWRLLQNIARWAGVHIYADKGDMVWANNAFLALYAQSDGPRTVRLPSVMTVEDAYSGEILSEGTTELALDMKRWETRLLLLS